MVSGTVQAKNVGLSKVDIDKTGTAIIIEDMIPDVTSAGVRVMRQEEIVGGVLDVFDRHRWIEPGETIEESFALPIAARADRSGVRLWLRVVSRHKLFKNIEWNADGIADLPAPQAEGAPAVSNPTQPGAIH